MVKPMNPDAESRWQRYGFSVLVVLGVIVLRMLLMPLLGERYPFVTLFPAVVVAAIQGGFGPGMLAALLSFGLAYCLGFSPGVTFSFGTSTDNTAMLINLLGATFVCFVGASMRRAKIELRSQQNRLEEIVARRTEELNQSNEQLRKEIEKRAEAETQMRAASVAKDNFIAALSHELRTPLNPVLLIASEAAANSKLAPEVRNDFDVIAKNVRLEARLIDDLLDVTRITHGKMTIDFQTVNVDEVLKEALVKVQDELKANDIRVELKFEAGHHTVRGDASRLQQVFWNVLKNAAKFTPRGGEVEVSTAVEGDRLVVKVRDNGIGMVPEELGRIFAPFAQGDHASEGPAGTFRGLGLGLSIALTLIESHGGSIEASSPGRNLGANFTIKLPLAEKSPEKPTGNAGAPTDRKLADAPAPRRKILLVEDDNSSRTALSRLLERRNFEVISAAAAPEALEAAAQHTFEFVISDIGLPERDGYSLMKELRAKYGLTGIALTGYGTQEDIASSEASGFVAHLTKPVSVVTLERAIGGLKTADGAAFKVDREDRQ